MLLKWNREEINNLVRNTLINCKTMRKKNVLMSAIAALAFAACSSDDVLLEQDTGIVTNPTGNARSASVPSVVETEGSSLPFAFDIIKLPFFATFCVTSAPNDKARTPLTVL